MNECIRFYCETTNNTKGTWFIKEVLCIRSSTVTLKTLTSAAGHFRHAGWDCCTVSAADMWQIDLFRSSLTDQSVAVSAVGGGWLHAIDQSLLLSSSVKNAAVIQGSQTRVHAHARTHRHIQLSPLRHHSAPIIRSAHRAPAWGKWEPHAVT